jgi:hypothetical protein
VSEVLPRQFVVYTPLPFALICLPGINSVYIAYTALHNVL